MFCNECGARNPDSSKFCSSCGHKVISADNVPAKELLDSAAALEKGLSFYEQGLWAEAIPYLEEASKTGDSIALFKLGNCHSNLGDETLSAPLWKRAADSGHTGAMNNYAIYLSENGKALEAETYLEKASSAGDFVARINRAFQFEEAGDRDRYLEELRICSDGGYLRARALLGFEILNDGDRTLGMQMIDEAVAGNNLTGYVLKASVLLELGAYKDVIHLCDLALKLKPPAEEEHLIANIEKAHEAAMNLENASNLDISALDPSSNGKQPKQQSLPKEKNTANAIEELEQLAGDLFMDENFDALEDFLIEKAERPELGTLSSRATNLYLEYILLPRKRLVEARVWAADLFDRNVGSESVRALANLLVAEHLLGVVTPKTRDLLKRGADALSSSTIWSLFAAAIMSGEKPKEIVDLGWEYNENWRQPLDVELNSPNLTLKQQYSLLLASLVSQGVGEDTVANFSKNPGATIYGLTKGILSALENGQIHLDRQVIAKVCLDYLENLAPKVPNNAFSNSNKTPETVESIEFITKINDVFLTPGFMESCWDEFQALSLRVVWDFENGTVVTYAPKEGLALQKLHTPWDNSDEISEFAMSLASKLNLNSDFNYAYNGIEFSHPSGSSISPASIAAVIEELEAEFGAPKLILPWQNIIDNLEQLQEEAEDLDEEELEDNRQSLLDTLEFFSEIEADQESFLDSLPWNGELTFPEDFMPEFSGRGRFYRLLDELEKEEWIVLNSECCGTCAASTLRDLAKEDIENSSRPSFVVYEQNAESKWGCLGWIEHNVYFENPAEIAVLSRVSISVGLGFSLSEDSKTQTISSELMI